MQAIYWFCDTDPNNLKHLQRAGFLLARLSLPGDARGHTSVRICAACGAVRSLPACRVSRDLLVAREYKRGPCSRTKVSLNEKCSRTNAVTLGPYASCHLPAAGFLASAFSSSLNTSNSFAFSRSISLPPSRTVMRQRS
eukprot:SAG31_NODE_3279_length_4470_cov_48.789293_3_plen_139_part_00